MAKTTCLRADVVTPTERAVLVTRRPSYLRWLLLTFATFVALPTIAFAAYLTFIKAPIYTSEARFSVRSNSEDSNVVSSGALSSMIAKMGISNAVSDRDDLYAIQNFLLSRNAIEAVGGIPRLLADFGGDDGDLLSRIRPDATQEDALRYWRSVVSVYMDSTSGILILKVGGFQPEAALRLTDDLVAASERFLNSLTRRDRMVALTDSESVLRQSADAMAAARARLLEFQGRSGILDPVSTVTQLGELIGELRLAQLELESMIEVGEIAGSVQSARKAERQAQLDIIQEQISTLESQLAGSASGRSVAALLREYETLRVDQEFTTEVYRMSRSSYEKARRQFEHQQRFIVQVVQPVAAEKPTEPRPLASSATAFSALFVIWGIIMLLIAAVRDR